MIISYIYTMIIFTLNFVPNSFQIHYSLLHSFPILCPLGKKVYLFFYSFIVIHWVQFVLPTYFQMYSHPLEKVNWLGSTSLMKTNFHFPRTHQLSISLDLQLGIHELLFPPAGMLVVLIMCRLCAGNNSCWVYDGSPVMCKRHCFVLVLPDVWLLRSFLPLFAFHDSPWALKYGARHTHLMSVFWSVLSVCSFRHL